MLKAHLKCTSISSNRYIQAIFKEAHSGTIEPFPSRLVLGLVHVVFMVANVVVKHPDVRNRARLQAEHDFHQPIKGIRSEKGSVLVVMVPGTHANLCRDACDRPGDDKRPRLNEQEYQKVCGKECKENGHWQPVILVTEQGPCPARVASTILHACPFSMAPARHEAEAVEGEPKSILQ